MASKTGSPYEHRAQHAQGDAMLMPLSERLCRVLRDRARARDLDRAFVPLQAIRVALTALNGPPPEALLELDLSASTVVGILVLEDLEERLAQLDGRAPKTRPERAAPDGSRHDA